MNNFRVRRLAVVDLHGVRGTALRRWLVRIEFLLAAILCLWLGVFFCVHGSLAGWVIGVALLGVGANYVVLTGWALVLWQPARLAREFAAHDIAVDGAAISIGQWRVAVPFLFLLLALRASERVI